MYVCIVQMCIHTCVSMCVHVPNQHTLGILYSFKHIQNLLVVHQMLPKSLLSFPHPMLNYIFKGKEIINDLYK